MLHTIVGTDTSRVKQVDNLFEGQIFYVIRGDKEQDKPELEIMIKEYGGVQSQSYQMENTLVVAGLDGKEWRASFFFYKLDCSISEGLPLTLVFVEVPGVDLVGLKKRGDRDIVLPTWIRNCIREKRRLPLNPK